MQDLRSIQSNQSQPALMPGQATLVFNFIWMVLAGMSIVFFVLGWPIRLQQLLHPSPGISAGLEKAGLTPAVWAGGMLGLETILMTVFTVVGFILFFQRRNEAVIFITSLALITFGTGILNVLKAFMLVYPDFDPVIRFQKAVAWALVILIFYLFPDGRFEIKWTRWAYLGWLVFTLSWLFFPELPNNPTRLGALSTEWVFIAYFGWLGSGVYVLFWRSIRSSVPEVRQKTKWVTTGLVVAVFIAFLQEFPTLFNNNLVDHTLPEGVWYALISTLIFCAGMLLVPLGIVFSIQQNQLWRIDFLINRAMVHGLMILFVIFGMSGFFSLLTNLLDAVTGIHFQWFPIVISGLVVFYLFKPTLKWVQSIIDKHVFGIHIPFRGDKWPQPVQGSKIVWTGQTVGRYRIGQLLRTGTSGSVYKGIETHTGKPVAIKFLHQKLASQTVHRKAFIAEAKTLSRLDHPNISKMLDYGEEGEGTIYLALEYLSDRTLADKLRAEGALSTEEAKYVLRQIADALEYAHQNEIIHLDVKPGNILLYPQHSAPFGYIPVLTDFGISRAIFAESNHLTNEISGTFDYISPEQIHSPGQLDRHADIYSLGVVAFQMVTGELPFQNKQPAAKLIAHLFEPPPNPMEINPDISLKDSLAIAKSMRKLPIERFSSVSEFVSAISD